MIDKLVELEERLTRIEAALLVGVVVFMLSLAVYNVFYRNVLIPLQVSVVEGATVEVEVPIEPEPEESSDSEESEDDGFGGGFGGGFEEESGGGDEGFGGGFDEEPAAEPDGEGFGGGFDDEPEPEAKPKESEPADEGFGGGFDDEPVDEGFGGGFDDGEEDEGFGGGFGGEADAESTDEASEAPTPTTRIERRGPEEGSFAYMVGEFVDAVKLEWIDLVLRQLVLVVGFLGSMLATRRRKHITIDALSNVLPEKSLPWIQVVTNLLSVVVCGFLAIAGWDLVEIGLEFPKEVTAFAEEWMFQLAFPIGFGMLALHFSIRLVESIAWGVTGEPVGTITLEERPAAASATAGGSGSVVGSELEETATPLDDEDGGDAEEGEEE